MRLRFRLLVLAVIAGLVPMHAAAQSPVCSLWDGHELHLSGRIGSSQVSVSLVSGWPSREPDGISGLVLDRDPWMAGGGDEGLTAVDGRMLPDCALVLKELEGDAEWQLRLVSRDRADGARTVAGRAEPLAFAVTAPFDCTAGRWTTFDAAGWPVTFDYPESAKFTPGVAIACPDVSRLAWGAQPLTIERVQLERDEDGRLRRVGPFVSDTAGAWLVGEDEDCRERDASSIYCNDASRVQWHGWTVLQGVSVGEDRNYRPGGGSYLGQGGWTTYYAFLLDDAAVPISGDELPEEIADLDAPPLPDERASR